MHAAELIRANVQSRSHHEPWIQPFTDADGFDDWFNGLFTGANVSFVVRDLRSGGVVGVVNLTQIFRNDFQSAYLGYYDMIGFARRGLMTEAVRLAARHAFDQIGLHRLEANIHGIKRSDMRRLIAEVVEQRDDLLRKWERIHGRRD